MSLSDTNQPDLEQAFAELDFAQARERSAQSITGLNISAQLRGRYVEPSELSLDRSHDDHSASLFARKRLYDFGRSGATAEAAAAEVQSQQWRVAEAREERRLDIMARFFDVPPATLQEWLTSVPEFAAAVRAGRTLADADVADRLWRRAMGYSHDAVRIFSHQGKALEVAYTEHYPPDTAACLFWLKSRQPDRWRERVEHDNEAPAEMLASLDAAGERAKNVRRD